MGKKGTLKAVSAFILLSLCLSLALASCSKGDTQDTLNKGADKVESGLEKGASAVEKGVSKGASAAEKGVKKGVTALDNALKKLD